MYDDQCNTRSFQHDLARLAKVYSDAPADIRLHLSIAPVGTVGMADNHARGQYRIQIGHVYTFRVGRMTGREDLAALIGSRICHDLISPLGAIGNGIELLGLSGHPASPEMALIAESVNSANARIRFFRVAYGPAEAGQMISRSEITGTLSAAARGGRLSYFWETEGDQPRREVRALFLLLQCCESAMPYGGDIHIHRINTGWEVEAESSRLRIDEALWTTLHTPRLRAQVSAAQVQFALLPEALTDLGATLALKLSTERIVARF